MTVWQAILEGVIQGATEFLPISSSGHLSLSQHFFGMQAGSLLFDVMLHLGTLAAVVAVYHRLVGRLLCELVRLLRDLFTGRFRWRGMSADRRLLLMLIFGLIPLFLLFLPVPGTGMEVRDFADRWATDGDIVIEGCSLLGTALLLTLGVAAGRRTEARHISPGGRRLGGRKDFTAGDALTVGFAQCAAAVFPGLSRSGSTLAAGLMRGVSRRAALDYSFVIGIPAILAAVLVEMKTAAAQPAGVAALPMVAGVVAAAAVGFLAIRLLRWMVVTDRLSVFVAYTFALGAVVVVLGLIEHGTGVNIATGAKLSF